MVLRRAGAASGAGPPALGGRAPPDADTPAPPRQLTLSETEIARTAPGCAARLPQTLPQRDLGLLIGASRSKVNVQIGRWIGEGILSRDGNALLLQDRDRLADIAETDEV